MRPLPIRLIATLTTLAATAAVAQPAARSGFDAAQRALAEGRCEDAVALAAPLRSSPRVESLRGVCLYASGDLVNARVAFARYLKGAPDAVTSTPAHQALVELVRQLDEELAATDQTFAATRDNRRLADAKAAADRTAARLDERARQVETSGARRMVALHAGAADKAAYEAELKQALPAVDYADARVAIRQGATSQSQATTASLGEALQRLQGQRNGFHVFPSVVTDGQRSYTLDRVRIDGQTIDYQASGDSPDGRAWRETMVIQGVDLARVKDHRTEVANGATVHVLEFDAPLIWRRGSARHADGKDLPGDASSSSGETTLRIQTPTASGPAVSRLLQELIDLAKARQLSR